MVVPAQAGMIPINELNATYYDGGTRASGDDPKAESGSK